MANNLYITAVYRQISLTVAVLTLHFMLGLALADSRSSTTFWWPLQLAIHSGVIPSYMKCVSVCIYVEGASV